MKVKPNSIVLGDCREVMPSVSSSSVAAVIADLPYGTTACEWDVVIPFEVLWDSWKRILKPNGVVVLTASQPFTSALVTSNMPIFKYEWIWIKNQPSGMALAAYRPMKYHESVCVFSWGSPMFNKQPTRREWRSVLPRSYVRRAHPDRHGFNSKVKEAKEYDVHNKNPSSVLSFDVAVRSKGTLHPTQKPVALFQYLIRTYTNPGDLVLDPTCGSGTTCLAAAKENRLYVGIEKDPDFHRIAVSRLERYFQRQRGFGI